MEPTDHPLDAGPDTGNRPDRPEPGPAGTGPTPGPDGPERDGVAVAPGGRPTPCERTGPGGA
ncbi:hypothetical protein ACWGAD_23585, partial [Streptomyces sp. NPDC055058]